MSAYAWQDARSRDAAMHLWRQEQKLSYCCVLVLTNLHERLKK